LCFVPTVTKKVVGVFVRFRAPLHSLVVLMVRTDRLHPAVFCVHLTLPLDTAAGMSS
jgi:hypothetical protein